MKTINTIENLEKYLRILAEESVRDAEVTRQQKLSSARFKSLKEEDPLFPDEEDGQKPKKKKPDDLDSVDEPTDQTEPSDEPLEEPQSQQNQKGTQTSKPDNTQPEPEQKPKKDYKPLDIDLSLGEITDDGTLSLLNLIRGSKSFNDPEIEQEFKKYFAQLSDAEKLALGVFLSAIKDIGTGGSAKDAPDLNGAKDDLTIVSGDKDQTIQQQMSSQQSNQTQTASNHKGLENTESPITVGKKNESLDNMFRKKIQEQIRKNNSVL